ncbi:Protein drl-1 [Caenorhabditis elegans]|uniref:Protein drl-1 n=1 Tax=Caenorhabditis elegans TaxID=6239 RepID=DRL1_CAEEL|nr:Protein drl-1 [Caenorhabditis elegans]Q86ME2.2 RecName: Full=Protein drl-1; AltName: Full=Dietary restriction-like protein 1 [Caenorhabditis elegans]CCD69674.2 Protein drl-1 [Caenorhabditis elegans]|eukprot:NP_001023134.2 Protein drl-1 [Caenorhabditis elegans]
MHSEEKYLHIPNNTKYPEIIVEEEEEDPSEEERSELSETDDVATPLRPSDTFPFKRRNSPCSIKMSEEHLKRLREIACPSPTPTQCSTVSKHEFQNWRINEDVMKDMMHIGTICERENVCKTSKYVYTATMASYTVTEWKLKEGNTPDEIEKISRTIEDLCQLRHKRLAPMYGYHWRLETELMVFRAHVPSGTVADLVKVSAIPQETAVRYIVHVIDALAYLHERKHVHGKLNASNLLLTISNDILLADPFIEGLPSAQKRRALLASPPEAFRSLESYPCLTPSSDIWSVGCVLVTMLTRYPPFLEHYMHFHGESLHRELVSEWCTRRQLIYSSQTLIPSASKEICELIDQIFNVDPENRPSAQNLLESHGSKSRKASLRNSLASLTTAKEPDPPKPIDDFYVEREDDEEHRKIEELRELAERGNNEGGFIPFIRWYMSRILIFSVLLVKWIGMVLCAALSLAAVAGGVFFAIFLIYNGIQIACQCSLNEGFVVLIALILLPIIILLTTLCCNNSLDRYHADVESGKVEKSRFVMKTPEKDVIVGGYILVEGSPDHDKPAEVPRKLGISEGLQSTMGNTFLGYGVDKIA